MGTQAQTLPRLRPEVFQARRYPRNLKRYGFREEEKLRCGLRSDKRLSVYHNLELDEIYKLDAVVVDLDAPYLPPVGVQFTTKRDPEKEERTLAAVRRHRVVARLLYLISECPLRDEALPMICDIVRETARQPARKAFIMAVLATDSEGNFCFRRLEELPLETDSKGLTKEKERTKTNEGQKKQVVAGVGAVVRVAPVRKSRAVAQAQLPSREGRHVFKLVRLRLAEGVRAEQVGAVSAKPAGEESGSSDRRNDRARLIGRRSDSAGGGKVWRVARAA